MMVSTVITDNVSSMSVETEEVAGKLAPTLKDGLNGRPPTLFRHASMQKIRHCCQNLSLFPYLLYSFDNSKSHLLARRMHLCFDQLFQAISKRLLFVTASLRLSLTNEKNTAESNKSQTKFKTANPIKRRQNRSPLLIMAVYLAPLLLLLQLIGLFSLVVLSKYTPGFIFLITVLFCLGGISLKILFHDSGVCKCEKVKAH